MSTKGISGVLRKTNLLSNIADATGVSKSNALVRLTNPADEVLRRGQKEGSQGIINYTKEGGVTDPFNVFHDSDLKRSADPGAPETIDSVATGMKARDRARRLAYRAQGRRSTVLVGNSMKPYTGQQQALIGS